MPQSEQEQIAHLEALIATLKIRLRILERQIAAFGVHAPPPLLLDRQQATQQLAKAQADLRRLRPAEPDARPPYLGLGTFYERDGDLFFGRDALVADLLARVERDTFLAVLGPSGSGKSSLVRAGLIPALKAGSLPNSQHWHYLTIRPGPHPLDTLAAALTRLLQGDIAAALTLSRELAESDGALSVAATMLSDGQEHARLVLVVDQFEELWTLAPEERAQRDQWIEREQLPFIRSLLAAGAETKRAPGSAGVLVILTMRADFVHRVAEQAELAHLVGEHDVIVSPMTEDELEEAIVRPAEAAGCGFEPGLVNELIEQVHGQPGALPLLEYTLLELWKNRAADGTLTWQAFEELGRVEGAIAVRADAILSAHYATPERQEQLRQVLMRLVQPGEGVADTRRRVRLVDLVPVGQSEEQLLEIIQPLTNERLLSMDRNWAAGSEMVEIAHEALIRAWPTFAAWIDTARADLRLQLQLEEAVKEWVANGEQPEYLWSGLRLVNATAWQARFKPQLNEQERRFLQASRLGQRRAAYVRRGTLAAIMLLLTIIAGGALFFAQRQQRLADDRLQAINTAEAARQDAERQNRLALARQLASQSLIYRPNDPELATLLAMQAVSVTLTTDGYVDPDADRALRSTLPITDTRISMSGHILNPYHVFFDPTGRVIASAGADDFALLWDAQTGKQLFKLQGHGTSTEDPTRHDIQNIVFSPSGDRLVTAGHDGVLKIWDVHTGAELHTLRGHMRIIADVAFDPSGKVIASAGGDNTVRLWDGQSGAALDVWQTPRGVSRFAFTQDGHLLAGSGANGSVWLWDMETRKERFMLTGNPADPLIGIAFSPDGRQVVSAGFEGTAYVWDTQTGERIATLTGQRGPVWHLAYSPLGDTIVIAGATGAWVWDVQAGKRLFVLSSEGQQIWSVAFRPDGQQIATGGNDSVVRLWNAQTGALEATLREENSGKPRGSLYSQEDKNQYITSDKPTNPTVWVAYNPSGNRLVSASGDGLIDSYVVKTADLLRIAASRVTRQLSCAELVQFLNEQRSCE